MENFLSQEWSVTGTSKWLPHPDCSKQTRNVYLKNLKNT